MAPSASCPGAEVVLAFGAKPGALVRLPGGRGRTWRADAVVIRPSGDREEADWKAAVLDGLGREPGFRTARPVRDVDGAWVRDGWEAWQWLPGVADESRVVDVIAAGAAFHRAVAALPCPAFVGRTDDAWSRADRMVWGEEPGLAEHVPPRLAALFEPVDAPAQLIHGDLLGNVLFEGDLPPAVIDWAPYWRPVGLGAAIAAVDAISGHGCPLSQLEVLGQSSWAGTAGLRPVAQWSQLVIRALAFRITTFQLLRRFDDAASARYASLVETVTRPQTV